MSISFHIDKEGFRYPHVNKATCIDCHLCETVCPVRNQKTEGLPLKTFAAINYNVSIRTISSSGGLFFLFASKIIEQGGVVFGARFNESWDVVIDYTDSIEGIYPFMGSKYVQADPRDSYSKAKQFLEAKRLVLFTGTPCQIAGLQSFLKTKYDNLILMDIICHGVPSPSFWQKYLQEIKHNSNQELVHIGFRSKIEGWKRFNMMFQFADKTVYHKPFTEDLFMKLFLRNYILRPSCYHCPAKMGKSGSDVTIGDFWGIDDYMPAIDGDLGVSALLLNTEKGIKLAEGIHAVLIECLYENVLKRNPCLCYSCKVPAKRDIVFRYRDKSIGQIFEILDGGTLSDRVYAKTTHLIKSILSLLGIESIARLCWRKIKKSQSPPE